MVDKHIEYKAEVLKLSGLAMFTPIGKIFIEPVEMVTRYGVLFSLLYVLLGIFIARLGLIFIYRGFKILQKEKEKI